MKKLRFVLLVLLLALVLAGCTGSGNERSDKAPSESAPKNSSNKAENDRSKPSAASAAENSDPSETSRAEVQPSPLMSFKQAIAISPDEYFDADGAFGVETTRYNHAEPRTVDLFFKDRAYSLRLGQTGGWSVLRHTNGQYWITVDHIGFNPPGADVRNLYAVADTGDILHQDSLYSADLRTGLFTMLESFNGYIQGEPEMTDYNGIPCWCYTAVEGYSGKDIPKGSVKRSQIYFRQDNMHFVYEQSDIVTPDGKVIPAQVMQPMSGKEVSEFCRANANLFADVDVADLRGQHTLTVVIDPGEADEITYRCPVNSGDKIMNYIPDRGLYMDRTGTVKASIFDIGSSFKDTTVYAIKAENIGKNSAASASETDTDPDSVNVMDYWAHFDDLCQKVGITGRLFDNGTFSADPIESNKVTLNYFKDHESLCIIIGTDLVEADGAKVDNLRKDFEPKLLANGWEAMGEMSTTDKDWAAKGWNPEKLILYYDKHGEDWAKDWYQMEIICMMTSNGPSIWTITIYDNAETRRG